MASITVEGLGEVNYLQDFQDKEPGLLEISNQEDKPKEEGVLVERDGTIMALPFRCARQEAERVLVIIQVRSEEGSFLRDLADKEPDLLAILKLRDQIKEVEVLVASDGTIMERQYPYAPQEAEQVSVITLEHSEEGSYLPDFPNRELALPEILKPKDLIREAEVSVANDGTITALPFPYGRLEVEPALVIIPEPLEGVNFLRDLVNKGPDLQETLKRKGQIRVAEA